MAQAPLRRQIRLVRAEVLAAGTDMKKNTPAPNRRETADTAPDRGPGPAIMGTRVKLGYGRARQTRRSVGMICRAPARLRGTCPTTAVGAGRGRASADAGSSSAPATPGAPDEGSSSIGRSKDAQPPAPRRSETFARRSIARLTALPRRCAGITAYPFLNRAGIPPARLSHFGAKPRVI